MGIVIFSANFSFENSIKPSISSKQSNEDTHIHPDVIVIQHETNRISLTQSKSYGTLSLPSTNPKLTYTWSNLDVFGESPQNISVLSKIKTRLKDCCTGAKKIPVPRKHLLQNISGIAYPGELLAVMGSSGAGKTTLLNALAFRSTTGVQIAHSSIRALNGVPIGAKELRERSAYVQQDDLFIGSLTAKEHLIFQVKI